MSKIVQMTKDDKSSKEERFTQLQTNLIHTYYWITQRADWHSKNAQLTHRQM